MPSNTIRLICTRPRKFLGTTSISPLQRSYSGDILVLRLNFAHSAVVVDIDVTGPSWSGLSNQQHVEYVSETRGRPQRNTISLRYFGIFANFANSTNLGIVTLEVKYLRGVPPLYL